jgi:hypothetical protein
MLSGVIAGAYNLFFQHSILSAVEWRHSALMMAVVAIPLSMLSLSGPLICRRKPDLIKLVVLWAVVLHLARCGSEQLVWSTLRQRMQKPDALYWIASISIYCVPYGVLFAIALSRLYGLKRCPKLAPILAIGGLLLSAAAFNLALGIAGKMSGDNLEDRDTNYFMYMTTPIVLLKMMTCVLPTIPIEWEWRRQQDEQSAASSPLTPTG